MLLLGLFNVIIILSPLLDIYFSIDAGFYQELCIGDYVWYDENLNGVQDSNESGVVGVTVILQDANGNSVTSTRGNTIHPIKTDATGHYSFCNLTPAVDYQIKFEIPETYLPTLQDQGSDLKDSDADSTGVIKVTAPTRDNMTYDLGIYCECDDYEAHPDNYKSVDAPALSIFSGVLTLIALGAMVARRREEG
jgi:hypothetical protein